MVPVVFFSVAINIPKFFESRVNEKYVYRANGTVVPDGLVDVVREYHRGIDNGTDDGDDFLGDHGIKKAVFVATTELRDDPNYIVYYTNWTRLVAIGLVPTVMLIYFNYKVGGHNNTHTTKKIMKGPKLNC